MCCQQCVQAGVLQFCSHGFRVAEQTCRPNVVAAVQKPWKIITPPSSRTWKPGGNWRSLGRCSTIRPESLTKTNRTKIEKTPFLAEINKNGNLKGETTTNWTYIVRS